jgi:hypothetical protein
METETKLKLVNQIEKKYLASFDEGGLFRDDLFDKYLDDLKNSLKKTLIKSHILVKLKTIKKDIEDRENWDMNHDENWEIMIDSLDEIIKGIDTNLKDI